MKFRAISTVIKSRFGRQILKVQKHSPTLLFGVGVVGFAATVVLACRATLKLEEILEEAQTDIEKARSLHQSNHPDYSETDYHKDLTLVYAKAAIKLSKVYGPAILTGIAAISSFTGSHLILNKRNVALTAAYAGLEKAFNEYRKKVVQELGEDRERELRYSAVEKKFIEKDKSGKEVEKVEKVIDPNSISPYARFFDELSPSWSKNPEVNLMFLRCQQNYANDKLHAQGHLFLNEVYDMLGIERTGAGAVVGWVIGKDSDNFVDFGIYDRNSDVKRMFVNGYEPGILLDFNVDGVIYDKI